MNGLMTRVAGWAMPAAALAAVSGCVSAAESPSQVRKQAGDVSLMISSRMGVGQLTEPSLIRIVEGTGGGYVTAITRSGQTGTARERTVIHAVLGTSVVDSNGTEGGLGEPVDMTPAVLCYRFTVGYYSYQVWQAQEPCRPSRSATAGGFAATAIAKASRVQSAENAIGKLPVAALARSKQRPSRSRRQLICWAWTGMRAR